MSAELLKSYRQIWKNRTLISDDESPENVLKDAITRELEDANSHPRVRKSIEYKFFTATKRITESHLPSVDKVALIQLHIDMVSQLKKVVQEKD
ncbi:hypothetical protein CN378_02315 [Bacillus sp. AFS015802]|uniref:hypothetical protein n=1 Tax=Bacillus sp. AFS015802 TaxID=2033486 RepID=UPI000BF998BB|nr:hypothetical protein [Bacillus sp. AFS015802]PFA70158.1 hypothetical protein CN378_02315 [Bacillus sp. AFS015802]